MKKPKYIPIYKCRLCEERFLAADVGHMPDRASKQEVHYCEDGGLGLADFVGFRLEGSNGEKDV